MLKSFGPKGILLFCLFLFIGMPEIFAFRPIGHVLLQRSIASRLPPGNIFRISMDSFPAFAAWGSVAPDIGYVPRIKTGTSFKRKMARSMNFADISHYYKTGSFCRELIKAALMSGDKELIAFAAGWVTHVAGDFGAHGLFVFPEAGYYLENEDGHEMHGRLEQLSETYLFLHKGKYLDSSFFKESNLDGSTIFSNFFGMPFGLGNSHIKEKRIKTDYIKIAGLIEQVFSRLYEETLPADIASLMKSYDLALGAGPKALGFDLVTKPEAERELAINARITRLNDAFEYSSKFGTDLLATCLENNFAAFSDSWNLDVGPNAPTLVVRTVIGSKRYSGSKKNLFIELNLDTVYRRQLNFTVPALNNVRYNKGDVFYSYIYLRKPISIDTVNNHFIISMAKGVKDRVVIESLYLFYEGKLIYSIPEKLKLNRKHPKKIYAIIFKGK